MNFKHLHVFIHVCLCLRSALRNTTGTTAVRPHFHRRGTPQVGETDRLSKAIRMKELIKHGD